MSYLEFPSLTPFEAAREVEARVLRLRGGDVALFKVRLCASCCLRWSSLTKPKKTRATTAVDQLVMRNEVMMRRDGWTFYGALGRSVAGLSFATESRCVIAKELVPKSKPRIWIMMFRESQGTPFEVRARQYAEKQGYGFLRPGKSCTIPKLPRAWLKHALLRHVMLDQTPGHDDDDGWILWLDPVALITNLDTRVESFIAGSAAENALMLVSSDAMPPVIANVGVLLARKSAAGAELIDTIWNVGLSKGWDKEMAYYWDQNVINYLLERGMSKREFGYWMQSLRVLPHRSLSSFMRSGAKKDLVAGHWKRGDFIALITGPSEDQAIQQANLLLEASPDDKTLSWIRRGQPYQPPEERWVPHSFSLPIDTYFPTNKPNFLAFPNRTPGTQKSTPINPTCLWADDEQTSLYCVVRTINYHLNLETGKYEWPARGMSVNLFFSLSARELLDQQGKTIVVEHPEEMAVSLPVQAKLRRTLTEGFEDVKLIRHHDQVYGVCTNLQMHPHGNCEIVMLTLTQHHVEEATPMRGFKPNDCHKNWMAFEIEGTLHFVETPDPLTVVTPKLPEGNVSPLYVDSRKRYPGLRLRGTSAGIPFHEGHLFVVHETVTRGKEYASRFMYLAGGAAFPTRKLSKPFFVLRKTVEFLIGIMLTKDQSRLLLCFGFEDAVPAFSVLHIESPVEFLERQYFWME